MDSVKIKHKISDLFRKNKYVLLVIAIGILLMLIPGKKQASAQPAAPAAEPVQENIVQELEEILGQIRGAGKVKVMLTVRTGPTTEYQYDEQPISNSTAGKKDTVIITDADRNETALIKRVIPASYQGAVIVCQGADSASVRLSIIEAVSKATGLGTDKITVLKMK